MATKAIYTKIDGNYYKVNQDTINPIDIAHIQRTHSQLNTDRGGKMVNTDIWINTLDAGGVYSNKELYDHMVQDLINNKILEIPEIQNHFVMYCDYSLINHETKEGNHNAFVYPIKHNDAMYPLGVNDESELIYKQIKVFNTNISLNIKNEYPMGIMRDQSYVRYTLQINDISIYQDLNNTEFAEHKSANPTAYPIKEVLESMVKVYSTHENGIVIAPVEIPFMPKRIKINLNVALDDLIIAYDEQNIKNIIIENISDSAGSGGSTGPDDEEDDSVLTIILNGGTATYSGSEN